MKWNKATEYTVECERCGIVDFIQTIDGGWKQNDTPKKFFARMGWTDKNNITLCPDCSKKFLDKPHNV